MNWNRVPGNWQRLVGMLRETWAGKLHRAGPLQGAYGIAKGQADRQINDWQKINQEVANDCDAGARIVNSRRSHQ